MCSSDLVVIELTFPNPHWLLTGHCPELPGASLVSRLQVGPCISQLVKAHHTLLPRPVCSVGAHGSHLHLSINFSPWCISQDSVRFKPDLSPVKEQAAGTSR